MEHFGAIFKVDLTEETRTQLQEEEAFASIASSCYAFAGRPHAPSETHKVHELILH